MQGSLDAQPAQARAPESPAQSGVQAQPRLPEPPSSALPSVGRARTLARLVLVLWGGALLTVILLPLTPWQQSVVGSGRVIAYAPLDRHQVVESPMDARVMRWFVQEGDRVAEGDPIAELSDNDPQILRRLREQSTAAQAQVDAAELSTELAQSRVLSLEAARASAIENARLRVQMARDRVVAAERGLDAASAAAQTAALNLTRQRALHADGLASKRDLELAELGAQTAQAELERSQASLRAARSEVAALTAERSRIESESFGGLESARAAVEKHRSDAAKARADLGQAETRLARQDQMSVLAPRDGAVLKLLAKQNTEMVKAGDPLIELVPSTGARAVELYVDGRDAALVEAGRHVRLQFEGWPAVQFVGWPSVAVGTFGGVVDFVDAHGDGRGHFRLVVVPDPKSEPWPDARFLRQGVRANGWILLDQVSLGFEMWRQLNGFPPTVQWQEPAPGSMESAK
ncbi:MAG: HlyD family efflux transporter periplasmic adaptor subunit [Myxococcales bacterium]|jgi:multidrug efflux pump subunit AcrA (membrane-fusion protein)